MTRPSGIDWERARPDARTREEEREREGGRMASVPRRGPRRLRRGGPEKDKERGRGTEQLLLTDKTRASHLISLCAVA